MKGLRLLLLFIAITGLALGPTVVSAADFLPIVKCGATGQAPCTPCDIFGSLKNIIDFILKGVTGPVAAFMIVYSGGMMLLGGGKPELYSEGKKMLTNTLIGVTIILLAWVVTNFLIRALMPGVSTGTSWFEFSCPASLSAIAPIDTTLPSPVPSTAAGGSTPAAPPTTKPSYAGISCPISNKINTCSTDYACQGCPEYRNAGYFTKYGADARILEAIMAVESSCGAQLKSPAGAYGVMQLLPAVANKHVQQCQIYKLGDDGQPMRNTKTGKFVYETITPAWLLNKNNFEKSVCLAAMEVRAIKGMCNNDIRNIAAGYNAGPGWCKISKDCAQMPSCGGGVMRAWECPWDNATHTVCNETRNGGGLIETKRYAPKVATLATCANPK
ncbi:MAG: transglycosylase SLT domain-containing protein [Candidatus Pacebacteria bacterium]|nr:transglycosylase SLT domain-containing protein [Candidatus Paceibacterota bacterium]